MATHLDRFCLALQAHERTLPRSSRATVRRHSRIDDPGSPTVQFIPCPMGTEVTLYTISQGRRSATLSAWCEGCRLNPDGLSGERRATRHTP